MATAPVTQFTHVLDVKWTGSNGTALAGKMTDVGNLEDDVVIQVPAGGSVTVNVGLTIAKLRQFMTVAAVGDLTLATSGGETILLKAGAATIFSASGGPGNPFTQDFASVIVTNAGGANAIWDWRSLQSA